LAAVVGPTLVVLTLGVLALLRQHDAVESLRVTTRRLQESRVADEFERTLTGAAAAALADPVLAEAAERAVRDDPASLDEAHRLTVDVRNHHPAVQFVFVATREGLRYPRVDPSLPHRVEDWYATEPAISRSAVIALLERATTHETEHRYADAVTAYAGARDRAVTRRLQAYALAGLARASAAEGDLGTAGGAWRQIATEYGDAYSLADRPQALVAALELHRRALPAPDVVSNTIAALERATWCLTPEQAEYFLRGFGRPIAGVSTPLGSYVEFAKTLRDQWQLPTSDGRTRATMVGTSDTGWQLFDTTDDHGVTRGVAIDPNWVRTTLLPRVATAVAPGVPIRVLTGGDEGTPLRSVLSRWRISAAPPPSERGPWLAFTATTVSVLGVLVLGVVLLMRDVSRQTDLNRLRADLVSGVSHELKTPLSVIRVYAETLGSAADATVAERTQFADAIVQETDRLHRVIDDVVDFSRIQQGQRRYRRVDAALSAIIGRVVDRFRDYASVRGLRLDAAVPSDLPSLSVDPLAVEQAVQNLLDNACKYSGDAKQVELRAWRGPRAVTVEVQDHGIGIARDEQARIFDRFHRGHHTDRGGYGLGLYLVRHVMEAHGGTVEVESEPGKGSRFRLHFPIEETHAEGTAHRG
jgi:signal transduction histidine kinase